MNKLNKGKAIGIVSLSLAAVSLAGVGFSAWVISGTTGKDTGTVNVEVADISDERATITAASVDTDNNSIKFDAVGSGTYISASSDASQDLTFSISYSVKVGEQQKKFSGVKGYIKESNCDMVKAVNSRYVTLPTGVYVSEAEMKEGTSFITAVAEMGTMTDHTYKVEKHSMSMGWGQAFNNDNPTKLNNPDDAETYITNLKTLKGYKLSFTLVLYPCISNA